MLSKELREFYHSSAMKEGILCWYPFKHNATVLDLSKGVLSLLLKSRCPHVLDDDSNTNKECAFDYIVVLDPDDFSVPALNEYKGKLKPDGKLLLAYENPFALRYWSGKSSPATGLSYDSLFGREKRVGKAELKLRLEQAGFIKQKWYYPLTDHWYAREIYSEAYMPEEYLKQRFQPYIDADANLQFDERSLYREIIRGGAFEFMCGAYLIEACVNSMIASCPADYIAITAYREPSKRLATVIRNDNTVHKIPLHQDGRKRTPLIIKNHEELAGLGVNVVPLRREGDIIVMPRLDLPTLWDYWVKKLVNGTFSFEEMTCHFDRIKEAIDKAAVDRKCWWELIPANCFYDEKNDELIFYDQEFYWENVSADVAMARALYSLNYSRAFPADPRKNDWLEQLKTRYGLNGRWNELTELAHKSTLTEVFGNDRAIVPALQKATDKSIEIIRKNRRKKKFASIPDVLKKKGFHRPIIYGYGRRGEALKIVMDNADIEIAALVDRNRLIYEHLEYVPEYLCADVVIVSVKDANTLVNELREKTNLPIFTPEELLNEQIN